MLGAAAFAQSPDPYPALRARDYDAAIPAFLQAIQAAPNRADLRKDLGYTYLKIGEPVMAREPFAEALRLDPADTNAALEYAFVCFETRKQAEARRCLAVWHSIIEVTPRSSPRITTRGV